MDEPTAGQETERETNDTEKWESQEEEGHCLVKDRFCFDLKTLDAEMLLKTSVLCC